MADIPWIDVPIGLRAETWVTVKPRRTVLVVAHNVTTITRLLDVLGTFDSDFRVQVVVSWSGSDPFHRGLAEVLEELGLMTMPWSQAVRTRFDLAIAASHHGGLPEINAPLVILSHGIGYTKYSPGNRKPETGNRKPETGNRQTFGLSPQWLLYDGQPIAKALVLSHPEQLERLKTGTPEAAHTAVLAGDPCYDRMMHSRSQREFYRRALGTGQRKLVVVSSTWSQESLLGSWPELFRQLLAEVDAEETQVAAVLHPNAYDGHGAWQLRTWLADCVRAGLVLLPPLEGWRAALIAADCVIGDVGAVTCYGAALSRPVLLAAFPEENVAAGSPVELLGRLAPSLTPGRSLRAQIDEAIDTFRPEMYREVADLVTSVPGESAARLRTLFYEIMALPEPAGEALLWRIPRQGLPSPAERPTATATWSTVVFDGRGARLSRHAAEIRPHGLVQPDISAAHLVVHVDHPARSLRTSADILFTLADEVQGTPADWLSAASANETSCELLAVVGPDRCLVRHRDGRHVELTGPRPAGYPSLVYAWLTAERALAELAPSITVTSGGSTDEVTVRVW